MALTFPGNTDFEQSAEATWDYSDTDLDTLIVPMRGRYTELSTYINGRTKWDASSIDGNMFLSAWPNDDHHQFPIVRLRFIGKKGGNIATTVRTSATAPTAVATYVQDEDNNLTMTYRVPTQTITSIDRDTMPHIGDLQLTSATANPVVEYVQRKGNSLGAGMTQEQIRDTYFSKQDVDVATSEELVPGQYYRNTITRTVVLVGLFS